MTQVLQLPTHNGWSEAETAELWQEVRAASAAGQPLRAAFARLAERTGRKANSVRNYYYAAVKAGLAPGDVPTNRALPFRPFAPEEIDELLRAVLAAQGQGVSVRACVLSLSGGDRSAALRLQNKYRALLRSHPERVRAALEQLRAEGIPCADPYRREGRSACESGTSRRAALAALQSRLSNMDEALGGQYLDLCLQLADLLTARGA